MLDTTPPSVQKENSELVQTLIKAAMEQKLLEQDIVDAHDAFSAFQAEKIDRGTQMEAADTADATIQVPGDAFVAPEPPTASRVMRRSAGLDITGMAQELAPEGVGVASVATTVLRAGLLNPAVCLTELLRNHVEHWTFCTIMTSSGNLECAKRPNVTML